MSQTSPDLPAPAFLWLKNTRCLRDRRQVSKFMRCEGREALKDICSVSRFAHYAGVGQPRGSLSVSKCFPAITVCESWPLSPVSETDGIFQPQNSRSRWHRASGIHGWRGRTATPLRHAGPRGPSCVGHCTSYLRITLSPSWMPYLGICFIMYIVHTCKSIHACAHFCSFVPTGESSIPFRELLVPKC